MVKRIIKETIHEYDADGKLLRETITETTEDDDSTYQYTYPMPWWSIQQTCVNTAYNSTES